MSGGIKYRPPDWPTRTQVEEALWRVAAPRALWLELGTATVVFGVLEQVLHTAGHVFARGAHLGRVLGLSSGLCCTLLLLLCALQLGACGALVVPAVCRELGAVRPSAFLTAVLAADELLLGHSSPLTSGAALQAVALALLALFRVDRSARNAALAVPTDSWLLRAEDVVRGAACAARARLVGPALALLLLAAAAQSDAFWRASRLDYERARAAFHTKLAAVAVCLLVAAQDNRPVRYSLHGWSNPFRRAKLL